MPIHGEVPYLNEAIRSVIEQSNPYWELILILDRPSSSTIKTSKQTESVDSRIRVFSSNSPGISSALNLGLKMSQSNLVARLDADDVMKPNRIQMQLNVMESNTNLVCLGSQAEFINSTGSVIGKSIYPRTNSQIRLYMQFANPLIHPSVMIRKSALEAVGGYNSELDGVEDYDLWLKLIPYGEMMNIDDCLIQYRRHPNQITRKNQDSSVILESLARLDALELLPSAPNRSWTLHLSQMESHQKLKVLQTAERVATNRVRRILISGRSVSRYFTNRGVAKILPIFIALANAPISTAKFLWMLFGNKIRKSTKFRINQE
jgi:glycosyltransferase involved in cell wall biosynthesis